VTKKLRRRTALKKLLPAENRESFAGTMEETCRCFDAKLYLAAAAMIGRALEILFSTELQHRGHLADSDMDKGLMALARKLNDLLEGRGFEKGWKQLCLVAHFRNGAVHRREDNINENTAAALLHFLVEQIDLWESRMTTNGIQSGLEEI